MKGFKEFLMRGNLIELAVAVIMGTAFNSVVKSFTDLLLDILGRIGGRPDFSSVSIAGIALGAFLSSLFAFVLTATVVYFGIVLPYNKMASLRKKDEPEAAASSEDLLGEIRDLLKEQNARAAGGGNTPQI
jgi:large conductance mechanosensitive channel